MRALQIDRQHMPHGPCSVSVSFSPDAVFTNPGILGLGNQPKCTPDIITPYGDPATISGLSA